MSNYMHAYMTISHLPEEKWNAVQRWIYEEHDGDLRYAFAAGYTAYDGVLHFDGVNDVNWSISLNELIDLSTEFPEALIEVDYSNGYIEDESRDYFQNGKMATYTPEVTWPEFNPNDLMEVVIDAD